MIVNPRNITIEDYWRECRRIQSGLPDVVVLASIPEKMLACNPDERERGSVHFIEADSLTAAQCLFAGTHRLAEPGEITVQEKKRVSSIMETARKHLANQGVVCVVRLPEQSSSK